MAGQRETSPRHSQWLATGSIGEAVEADLNGFAAIALVSFWTAFVVLYSFRAVLLAADPMDNMLPRVLVALIGAGLSWVMYQVLARIRPKSVAGLMISSVAISVPTSVLFAIGHQYVFTPLAVATGPGCSGFAGGACAPGDAWTAIVDNTINWIFLFSAWGLLQLTARSTVERWAADHRASEQREAARVAEIRSLRYQVNPHFLFNCLNSLATLVRRKDTKDAEAMIGELGAFLRYGLATDTLTDVDLCNEIDMQRRYLVLECRRFAHRLTVEIDVADDAERARVPSLILQPLVENAIKHGVAMTTAQTLVAIRARILPDRRLSIVVEDDAWADPGEGSLPGGEPGFGIGLRNVAERLAARFEGRADCIASRLPAGGFRVELTLPLVGQ